MIYKVIFKVGYNEAEFDFEDAMNAVGFAECILTHSVDCEDTNAKESVTIEVLKEKEGEDNGEY